MKQDFNVDVHSNENVDSIWLAKTGISKWQVRNVFPRQIKGDRRDGKITSDPLQDNSCEVDPPPIAVCRGDLKSGYRVSRRVRVRVRVMLQRYLTLAHSVAPVEGPGFELDAQTQMMQMRHCRAVLWLRLLTHLEQ